MMRGKVKTIVPKKNFGFIFSEGKEYFFHREDFTGYWDDLVNDHETERNSVIVEFEAKESNKGPRASNVRRIDFPNQAV